MKETVPFSQKQMSKMKLFKELRFISDWLEDFIEDHEDKDDIYYQHIDQFQIVPNGNGYCVFVLYHQVYLNADE